jgi:hypothetical protein
MNKMETHDPYYCLYNTKLMDDFINDKIHAYEVMYKGLDMQVKFLTSKVQQLETELENIKKCDVHKHNILYDGEAEHKRYYEGHTAKFVVDGLNNKTVHEFNGCKFHGCKKCFPGEIGIFMSDDGEKGYIGKGRQGET